MLGLMIVGCSGGNKLIVGPISGPDTIDEVAWATFSVDANGDEGITYDWTVDPPNAGEFDSQTTESINFRSVPISGDQAITIMVMVNSDNEGPIIRSIEITILDTVAGDGTLLVSNISGPLTVDEHETVTYSVEASGCHVIDYAWTVDPPSAGFFSDPDSDSTGFTPYNVSEPTEILIGVEVSGCGCPTETRMLDVTVLNVSQTTDGWVKTWGSHYSINEDGYEHAGDMCFSPDGTILVAGYFLEVGYFNSDEPDEFIRGNGSYDSFVSSFNRDGSYNWTVVYGGESVDYGLDVITDSSGNIYAAGYFEDQADFDPGPEDHSRTAKGYRDAYIVKLNPEGEYEWVVSWGGPDNGITYAYTILCGPDGNIYAVGTFDRTTDFDSSSGVTERTPEGNDDVYIVSYTPSGNFRWVRTIGGNYSDGICDISVTSDNHLLVAGWSGSAHLYLEGAGGFSLDNQGAMDVYLGKYDLNGNFINALGIGNDASESVSAFETCADGSVYIAEYFSGDTDVDPGPGEIIRSAPDDPAIAIIRLDSELEYVSDAIIEGDGYVAPYAINVDDSGNVLMGGVYSVTIDFDPGPAEYYLPADGADQYILKLDSGGEFIFAGHYGANTQSVNLCGPDGILTDEAGDIYIAGTFSGSTDFDPGLTSYYPMQFGGQDLYLMKLNSDGQL